MSSPPIVKVSRRRILLAGCFILAILPSSPRAQGQSLPEKHFSVEMPAELPPEEAEAIYGSVLDDMTGAYVLSQDPNALNYRRWRRFNSAPYPSATHGTRYVNNYGNALARAYRRPEIAGTFPEGTVLAKDSFAVTDDGNVFVGPLFLMEKMASGFDPKARDWRYSMIMPDGSFFGMTGGDNADRVRFCITCHETAGDENDHLFFVPAPFQVDD